MRIRVVLSGMVAATFCVVALWFPWYMLWPTSIVPDWPYLNFAQTFPSWFEIGVVIFCAFTLFTFGWISARWNWSANWRESLFSGAGAGLIAGCLIYDLIGAFHYGLIGQVDLLKSFYTELTETKGLTLLVDAISSSAIYLYGNFLVVVASSAVLGALGGLASAFDVEDVWGSPPRNPESWLFRLPAYTLTLSGAACMIVMIAVFSTLQESVVKTVVDNELRDLNTPVFIIPVFIFLATYLVGLAMTIFPLSITWGWAIRAWRSAGLWRALYVIWVVATFYLAVDQLTRLFQYGSNLTYVISGELPVSYVMVFLLLAIIIAGLILGWLSEPVIIPDSRHRVSDWLGYALTQGILGGTQLFISVPAYALVLSLITIVNIPHLTQSGIVDQSPAQQIVFLSRMLTISAEVLILVCLLGGLLFGLLILPIRKFLKIAPVMPDPDLPVPKINQ